MNRATIAGWLAIILFLPVLLIIKSCEKEESGYPIVFTGMEAQVTEEGVSFSGKIIKKGDPVIDHGFVWDLKMPYVNSGYRKSLGGFTREDFSIQVNSGLIEGGKYFFRAYAQTQNAVIYGEVYSFISQGSGFYHKIIDFSPLEASWGDTLIIRGEHFSLKKGENIVTLQSLNCQVIKESDTLIMALVPENLFTTWPANLRVRIHNLTVVAEEKFSLLPSQINDFFPTTGIFQDTIEIFGENFHPRTTVNFSGAQAEVVYSSSSLLKVKVPNEIGAREGHIDLHSGGFSPQTTQKFHLLPHRIDQLVTQNGVIGGQLQISGWGFNPQGDLNFVAIDGKPAQLVSAEPTLLTIKIPQADHGEWDVSVTILDHQVISSQTLMLYQPWTKIADPPFLWARAGMFLFTLGDRYFLGGGHGHYPFRELYEYFPESNQWQQRQSIPWAYAENVLSSTAFTTQGMGYIIAAGKLLSYDPVTNNWQIISDFFDNSQGHATFNINDVPYVAGGGLYYWGFHTWKNTRRFNGTDHSWDNLADYPGQAYHYGLSFAFNGKGYAGLSHDKLLHIYDPATNNWTGQLHLPGVPLRRYLSSFIIDQKVYFGTGISNNIDLGDFYELNMHTGQVRFIGEIPGLGMSRAVAFSTSEFGYMYGFSGFYKFDPSKLPPE